MYQKYCFDTLDIYIKCIKSIVLIHLVRIKNIDTFNIYIKCIKSIVLIHLIYIYKVYQKYCFDTLAAYQKCCFDM